MGKVLHKLKDLSLDLQNPHEAQSSDVRYAHNSSTPAVRWEERQESL